MNISNHWLRSYVDHDLPAAELADRLTMLGLEVERVSSHGFDMDGIVVGKVTEIRDHPNADRLVLCSVMLGDGSSRQIICGAPNVAPGQFVPVVTVGTSIPTNDEPLTVRSTTIRGEDSEGMICSEAELGLSEDHSGIMVLNDSAEPGESFESYLKRQGISPNDDVFDIDITPNRPDATSHIGVARDVAAWTGIELNRPDVELPGNNDDHVEIDLKSPSACPRYVAMIVKDVTIGESPLWLRRHLTAIGLRPRNNIVDITNFVMHECGQPLHAFDLNQLAGPKIVVETTEEETEFTTLDGEEHEVPAGSLFIRDAERPVALAGIMGGANSEVTDDTRSVLIESAYFDPATIRRTASALGLSTDSSYRFERGIDTSIQRWAAARAGNLIAELAGGTMNEGAAEAVGQLPETPTLSLDPVRANKLLGTDLDTDAMVDILTSLEFDVSKKGEILSCTAPPFRPDVSREVDLIEEIGRLHGYDAIPAPKTVSIPAAVPRALPDEKIRNEARELLKGHGLREVYNNSMLPLETADSFNAPELQGGVSAGPVVQTLKPISQQMAALRPSMLPGLLQTMQHNKNHGQKALRFFEIGHVFRKTERQDTIIPGYSEHESLIIGISGPRTPIRWSEKQEESDAFDVKGVVSSLLQSFHLEASFTPTDRTHDLTMFQVDISVDDTHIGALYRIDAEQAEAFDLEQAPVLCAELDWSTVASLAASRQDERYRPISRHPVVERDLALVLPEEQPIGPVAESIRNTGAPLLKDLDVFDLYRGEHLPEGKKSIALSLTLGANRTLKDEEVDKTIQQILDQLRQAFSAEIRQ